jgi:Golgi nucleoside diphosphatase
MQAGARSLMPLLSNAKEYVPQDLQSQSPILLKATAGLRMLGESEANALLQESRLLLGKSGFKFEASTGVEIMDGLSEAMFAWVTINYLRSSLSSGWQSTALMLDLGGGSTQIAMDIGLSKGSVARTQDIKEMTLLGNPHRLYLHSFLG